jgi:SAM-dependent methyltransferase
MIQLYSKQEYEKLFIKSENLANALSEIAYNVRSKVSDNLCKKKKDTGPSYSYIHMRFTQVLDAFEAIRKHVMGLKKSIYNMKFVDAGCGFPIIPAMIQHKVASAIGFEIEEEVIAIARACGLDRYIIKQDILTADYSKFDIIYYYCPFRDTKVEKEFEKRVEEQMKPGAYLMFALKQDWEGIKKNPDFKLIYNRPYGEVSVFIKKEGAAWKTN